jgi:hypothetical protein
MASLLYVWSLSKIMVSAVVISKKYGQVQIVSLSAGLFAGRFDDRRLHSINGRNSYVSKVVNRL